MTAVGFVLFSIGLLVFVIAFTAGKVYPEKSPAWEASCSFGAYAALAMIVGWVILVATGAAWLFRVAP